jgi:hypothetical protein
MQRHHAIAIIGGLAVGAFLGYEFASTLMQYPPYNWIATYYTNQVAASVLSQATGQS